MIPFLWRFLAFGITGRAFCDHHGSSESPHTSLYDLAGSPPWPGGPSCSPYMSSLQGAMARNRRHARTRLPRVAAEDIDVPSAPALPRSSAAAEPKRSKTRTLAALRQTVVGPGPPAAIRLSPPARRSRRKPAKPTCWRNRCRIGSKTILRCNQTAVTP